MAVKSCASILDATDLHDIDIIENTEPEARVIKHTLASYSSRLVKNREGLTALVRDRQYVANLGSLLSHLGIIPNCASFGLIFAVLLIGVGIIYKINALTLIAGIAAVFFLVLMLVRGSHQSMLSDKKMYEIGIANDETEIAKLQPAYDQLEGRVAAVYVKRPELKSLLSSFRGNAASEEVQNVGVGLLGEDFGADPLYDKAVQLVLKEQKISIFLLHNHFKIGFDRASYLIEQMEREGIVSAMEASGHRKVVAR